MTADQEQLEKRLWRMVVSMARMSGLVETLVQNQSQPLLLTGREQADVLRAQLQAERRKAAAEVAAGGTTEADPEESADALAHHHRNWRTIMVCEPGAHTGGVRSLVVQARGSRPAADIANGSARIGDARPPVV